MWQKRWVGWAVLAVLIVVSGVALALTNAFTKGSIAAQEVGKEQVAAIFPEADAFDAIILSQDSGLLFAYTVKQGGEVIGHAGAVKVQGYAGPMEITLGVEPGGRIRGLDVGGPDFKETEGLGSKARDAEFRGQFNGKTPPVTLGEGIDAISGATVTSRAVAEGVNSVADKLWFAVGIVPNAGPEEAPQSTAQAGRKVNASVMGYAGPVLVELLVDDEGTITSVTVGRARFMETEGLGSKVREEPFLKQFVGKKPPLSMDQVDAVSGATISSEAVVKAINAAYGFMNGASGALE